ncbi:hypothetical protein ANN_05551 [Periplaneta americana]|uniref:GIY-YIG domain-containing protein n=1 Tax=Periplaneta americana TaxID=6978 RepID=A0ABQ8TB59_PERAM|nr:hypothetical protein ANN_05551 [Periplaneta americana]
MDLREVGCDDRDWINLAQDRDRWRAYINVQDNRREDSKEVTSPLNTTTKPMSSRMFSNVTVPNESKRKESNHDMFDHPPLEETVTEVQINVQDNRREDSKEVTSPLNTTTKPMSSRMFSNVTVPNESKRKESNHDMFDHPPLEETYLLNTSKEQKINHKPMTPFSEHEMTLQAFQHLRNEAWYEDSNVDIATSSSNKSHVTSTESWKTSDIDYTTADILFPKETAQNMFMFRHQKQREDCLVPSRCHVSGVQSLPEVVSKQRRQEINKSQQNDKTSEDQICDLCCKETNLYQSKKLNSTDVSRKTEKLLISIEISPSSHTESVVNECIVFDSDEILDNAEEKMRIESQDADTTRNTNNCRSNTSGIVTKDVSIESWFSEHKIEEKLCPSEYNIDVENAGACFTGSLRIDSSVHLACRCSPDSIKKFSTKIDNICNEMANSKHNEDVEPATCFILPTGLMHDMRNHSRKNISEDCEHPSTNEYANCKCLNLLKDEKQRRSSRIYKIPCECGEVYIGQTGRTIEDRIKEHKRNLRLYYPEKSAVAQHSIEKEHKILFDHTKVINKLSHYWDRTIKEAIEIKLEKNNFNRDSGLQLSQAWTPALDQLRPSYNQGHEDHGPRTATDSNRRNRARRPPNFTQESREGRSLRAMTIPGPGLADPPTNPVSPETA